MAPSLGITACAPQLPYSTETTATQLNVWYHYSIDACVLFVGVVARGGHGSLCVAATATANENLGGSAFSR